MANVTPLYTPVSPELALAFVECHSEGHQWRPAGVIDPMQAEPGMRPPSGSFGAVGRRSNCVSCTAERVRWYTRSGEVVPRYRYPAGYLHKKADPDDAAPSKLDWRKRLVVTLFDDLGAPPARAAARTRRRS